MIKCAMIIIIFLFSASSIAAPSELYPFFNVQLQQRFQQLNKTLRCLVCQNQDLADSHAPLAEDLRQQIYQQLQQGKTDEDIINYLTSRYGDFILFKPPFKGTTIFLWMGPFIFLIIGFYFLVKNINSRKS